MANEVHHGFIILQRLPLPIAADVAEQAMLNRIPFRRSRRVVCHRDSNSPAIGQLLQLPSPRPHARVVAAAAVRLQKPVLRLRVTPPAMFLPPQAHSVGRESSRLVRGSHHHETRGLLAIVDAERYPPTQSQ